MRQSFLPTTALGAVLLLGTAAPGSAGQGDRNAGTVLAQAPGTNLGTPSTQPQPGGGVATGPGAPTSATPATPDRSRAPDLGRGPPPPGSATPLPGGNVAGSSQLGPTGAVVPGSEGAGGGTGGSQSSSTP